MDHNVKVKTGISQLAKLSLFEMNDLRRETSRKLNQPNQPLLEHVKLSEGLIVNIYTDSWCAFGVIYDLGMLW